MEATNSSAPTSAASKLSDVVRRQESAILSTWVTAQLSATTMRRDLIKESELRQESAQLLRLFSAAVATGAIGNFDSSAWTQVKEHLAFISRTRARQGFSPGETATFVFSLKEPLFTALQQEQIRALREFKRSRDASRLAACLQAVRETAALPEGNESNLMAPIREAVKGYATIGEIFRALKDVFGEHHG